MNPVLIYHHGYAWIHLANVSFKGFFFDGSGTYFEGQHAAGLFKQVKTISQLQNILESIDGSFSVVIHAGTGWLIGTDAMTMFPIYYTRSGSEWALSDKALALHPHTPAGQESGSALHLGVQAEFLSAGFVLGRDTLIRDVYRTQAGTVTWLRNDGAIESARYTHFLPLQFIQASQHALEDQLHQTLEEVTKRLLASLKGQTLVIPLSGGYDSRLIACMLKRSGYEKVVCFTYGKPNPESKLSQRVAKQLGYPWIFADYDTLPADNYLESEAFLAYCDYAGNAASMPYLQEYFGMKYLHDNKLIPPNSLFLPGHSGDFLGGSYVEKTANISSNSDLSAHIAEKYFWFLPHSLPQKHQLLTRLNDWFNNYKAPEIPPSSGYCPWVEDWDVQEKLAKFIFNSAHVFTYFGYGIRLPLWEKNLRQFFRQVPFRYRSHKMLYDKVLEDRYFKPLGVYFGKDELNYRARVSSHSKAQPGRSFGNNIRNWKNDSQSLHAKWLQHMRSTIKKYVPFVLVKRKLQRNDWICYARYTREMVEELRQKKIRTPQRFYSYNALICTWYIHRVTEQAR